MSLFGPLQPEGAAESDAREKGGAGQGAGRLCCHCGGGWGQAGLGKEKHQNEIINFKKREQTTRRLGCLLGVPRRGMGSRTRQGALRQGRTGVPPRPLPAAEPSVPGRQEPGGAGSAAPHPLRVAAAALRWRRARGGRGRREECGRMRAARSALPLPAVRPAPPSRAPRPQRRRLQHRGQRRLPYPRQPTG